MVRVHLSPPTLQGVRQEWEEPLVTAVTESAEKAAKAGRAAHNPITGAAKSYEPMRRTFTKLRLWSGKAED